MKTNFSHENPHKSEKTRARREGYYFQPQKINSHPENPHNTQRTRRPARGSFPGQELKRASAALTLLTAAALTLTACGRQADKTEETPLQSAAECAPEIQGQERLVMFGESQAQGIVSQVRGCRYSYGYVLASSLSLNILNQAKGGSTLLAAGPYGPSQHNMIMTTEIRNTDTILWMTGFNDITAYYAGLSPTYLANFKETLNADLTYLAGRAKRVIILTPFRDYAFSSHTETHETYVTAVTDAVGSLNLPNVTLLQTDSLLTVSPQDYLPDHSHINQQTQAALGAALSQAVTPHP